MLNRRTLQRINERPKSINRRPLLIVGAGSVVLAAVLAMLLSMPMPALGVLAVGVVGVLILYRAQASRMTTTLTYDLDAETRARFEGIQEAMAGLASAKKVWRVAGETGRRNPGQKPGTSGTSRNGRQPVRVGRLKPPGIRCNLPISGIDAPGQKVYFFPEAVLVLKERYTPVPYSSLEVSYSAERSLEEEGVPADAEVVGRTWRYVRSDGSPDRRYTSNPEIPVVLYGLIEISGPSGFEVQLLVSDRDAAAGFARTFAEDAGEAAQEEEPGDKQSGQKSNRTAREIERDVRIEAALGTLGVGVDASAAEISAAYREMARLYHPDKVANETVEIREFAEQRMKEINAAYALLKRRGTNATGGV